MTQEQQSRINAFGKFADTLEEDLKLTLFQIAFLKEIFFFNEMKGEFFYNKIHTANKYSEILTPEEIEGEILDLLSLGVIKEKTKKTIFNAKFITNKYFIINVFENPGF